MRFSKQILPQLVDQKGWFAAVETISSPEVAQEFFGIKGRPATENPIMKLPDGIRNIGSGSPDMVMRACDLLINSIYDWETDFRSQVNAIVSQILGHNAKKARLLTKCIRDAEREAKEYDRLDRQKSGTPDQLAKYRQSAEEARSRAETLRTELKRCRLGLEVPTQALVALGESTAAADGAMTLLDDLRKRTFSLLESRTDRTNLQFGMLKDEQYVEQLSRLTQSMSRGPWYETYNRSIRAIDVASRAIYDNDFSTGDMSLYPTSATADMERHLSWCRKECDRYRKRLRFLKSELSAIKGGRPTAYSLEMICRELAFWSTYLVNFSAVMAGSIEPQLAIVNGIARDGRE